MSSEQRKIFINEHLIVNFLDKQMSNFRNDQLIGILKFEEQLGDSDLSNSEAIKKIRQQTNQLNKVTPSEPHQKPAIVTAVNKLASKIRPNSAPADTRQQATWATKSIKSNEKSSEKPPK